MSEFDSESGRKGFVRDVMRRISSTGLHGADEPDSERERVMRRSIQEEIDDLREAMRFFGGDSAEFRRRLDRVLAEYEALRGMTRLLEHSRELSLTVIAGRQADPQLGTIDGRPDHEVILELLSSFGFRGGLMRFRPGGFGYVVAVKGGLAPFWEFRSP